MNYSKRHGEILKLIQDEGTITIARLADRLGVSLETVRRDVKPLAKDGSVLKMHGAIGLPSVVGEAPFERRMREQSDAKRAIARMVAATIGDGTAGGYISAFAILSQSESSLNTSALRGADGVIRV